MLQKSGKVYTFGANDYKTLGLDNDTQNGGIASSKYAILKTDVEDVERVTAGLKHTSVYTKDRKSLYMGCRRKPEN